ncbi:taste receptor type 2 member 40-like [Mantella aurantiaca]
MVVYYMEFVLALSLNICIIVLHGKSLNDGAKQKVSIVIQLTMGVINLTMRSLLCTQFLAMVFPNFRFEGLYDIALVFLPFQMYISNWLIGWLCAYYCVSIINFTHQVFIWVRRILSTWLPWVLLLSGVGCFALSIPILWIHDMAQVSYTDNSTGLYSRDMNLGTFSPTYIIISIILGFCLPFVISSFSLLTTVVSLFRHVWNIKHHDSGFSPSRVQVHINAIRTMILFLLLSIIFYISEMTLYSLKCCTNIAVIISWVVVIVFPTLEAAIIIQSSSRLSKMFLGRFCAGKAVESES